MDLHARQTRGFFLAGTVAIPSPYPSTGTISFDVGHFTYSPQVPDDKDKKLVVVHEFCRDMTIARSMLQEDVSAIFVPGVQGSNGFQISHEPRVDDSEQGIWFVDTEVNATTIRTKLGLQQEADISTSNSVLRGIVFIEEDKPMIYTAELYQTAGADEDISSHVRAHSCTRISCTKC